MYRITQRSEETHIRIGTFNTQGLKSDIKLQHAAEDMEHFKIDVLAIQETHITGNGVRTVKTTSGK